MFKGRTKTMTDAPTIPTAVILESTLDIADRCLTLSVFAHTNWAFEHGLTSLSLLNLMRFVHNLGAFFSAVGFYLGGKKR
jgi:hypothetical protein